MLSHSESNSRALLVSTGMKVCTLASLPNARESPLDAGGFTEKYLILLSNNTNCLTTWKTRHNMLPVIGVTVWHQV